MIGGVLLMLGGNAEKNGSPEVITSEQSIILYEDHLEQRIKKLCEEIDGVSFARVMVTLECGYENVYAKDDSFLTVGSGS